MIIGPVGFAAPLLLLALAALPLLWFLLRAVPPAPMRRRFPAVTLLLGLRDKDNVADRTPWWLLLIRILAVAAVIVGLAGPVLNPRQDGQGGASKPLLIVLDDTWASARDWSAQNLLINDLLAAAIRDSRKAAVASLSKFEDPVFQTAGEWQSWLAGRSPRPWHFAMNQVDDLPILSQDKEIEIRWMSDGLAHAGRVGLLDRFEEYGDVEIHESPLPVIALAPAKIADGGVEIHALRSYGGSLLEIEVEAYGLDPAGLPAILAKVVMEFASGETEATAVLSIPSELRARLTRLEIVGQSHAGAVSLIDDSLKRREVALVSGLENREGLELLSPLHYLEQALEPSADIINGSLEDVLPANPDVVVLADKADLPDSERESLLEWVDSGGLLLRFAGPKLAASDFSRFEEDPLMPVKLRAGGRSVGGAMSWGQPRSLSPFSEESPFFGLSIPDDVTVTAQVLAQPGPELSRRVIARLADGTPLATRKRIGSGQVVLFHVTASAEWSSLPLSGLFVQMLERLAVSTGDALLAPELLAGTVWKPISVLDGFGRLRNAENLPGVDGGTLLENRTGPDLSPGMYEGPDQRFALNVISSDTELAPMTWPDRVTVRGFERSPSTPLGGWLLAGALLLLLADIAATLALSGRLFPLRATVAAVAMALFVPANEMRAQDMPANAITDLVLAHVLTGDEELDNIAYYGLLGLGQTLHYRTSVEPDNPVGINIETDDLNVYPMLYWPISEHQPLPSEEAYSKLNHYMRTGGLILFDTRIAPQPGYTSHGSAFHRRGNLMDTLGENLDIPKLQEIPDDHVITRSFYLLQDFPGRNNGPVWVEAGPENAERIEGMPFRNLNDNVTPVVVGGNDWAAAWAMDPYGNPMYPVGRGQTGERQREIALRFGVNLVMHVLTGNYKSDQVHVPALLERLGH